jgi:hypothetical protein
LVGYCSLTFSGAVKVDQRGPRGIVAHALHQLTDVRACVGRELVAGVPQVVKVNAL